MKIRKLVVGFLACAMMVATMATAVFASSAQTNNQPQTAAQSRPAVLVTAISGSFKAGGQNLTAKFKPVSSALLQSAEAMGTGTVLKAFDFDSIPDEAKEGPIQFTLDGSVFKAGMNITILVYDSATGTWKAIKPDSIVDGKLAFTFPNGLAPVVITAEGISDKTGESAPVLPIMAAICLAGVVYFGAKMRLAK